ncbi:MAG TPA: hypothetical protein VFR58_04390 [Flavisolibacter sp.]|nr:hypothetical protein [Flavisolibacter sp.]
MKTYILLLLLLPLGAAAQQRDPGPDYTKAISFSPLALAQIDFTMMLGAEYRLRPGFSLYTDAGYIFSSAYLTDGGNSRGASGFIIRPAARFYLRGRSLFYLQPQVFYKQVTHRLHDWLGKNCVEGVPAFEQLQDFRYRRQAYGFNGVVGALVPLSRRDRVFFDFYLGLGVRYKKNAVVKEPNCCFDRGGFVTTINRDEGSFPSIPAGVKLVIAVD